ARGQRPGGPEMRARTAGGSRRAGAVRRGLLLGALAAAALVALLLAQAPFGALRGALDAEPHGRPPLPSPRKQAWEREHGGPIEARVHLRRRLVGWPERRLVPPEALPADDRAFLERVAADTWRGIAALVDREHALPIDHIVLGPDDLDPRAADIGDYT